MAATLKTENHDGQYPNYRRPEDRSPHQGAVRQQWTSAGNATSQLAKNCWRRPTRPKRQQQREALRGFLEMCNNEDHRTVRRIDRHRLQGPVATRRQHHQHPVHSSLRQRARRVRVLHSRWRYAVDVVLRRQLPRLGAHHRGTGRGGCDGRLPQRPDAVVSAGSGAVPRRSERLRIRFEMGCRERREARHRYHANHHCRRKRRRKSHARDRPAAETRWRP